MKFTITFNGNDKKADGNGPTATFQTKAEAVEAANSEAESYTGHPDFVGGQFDVDQIDGEDCERVYSSTIITK